MAKTGSHNYLTLINLAMTYLLGRTFVIEFQT